MRSHANCWAPGDRLIPILTAEIETSKSSDPSQVSSHHLLVTSFRGEATRGGGTASTCLSPLLLAGLTRSRTPEPFVRSSCSGTEISAFLTTRQLLPPPLRPVSRPNPNSPPPPPLIRCCSVASVAVPLPICIVTALPPPPPLLLVLQEEK